MVTLTTHLVKQVAAPVKRSKAAHCVATAPTGLVHGRVVRKSVALPALQQRSARMAQQERRGARALKVQAIMDATVLARVQEQTTQRHHHKTA